MGLITSCLAFARNGLGLEPVSNAPAFNNSNMQPGMVSNIDPARIMGTRPRILRHRCRIRILHSLIIATSVCVLIVDIAGRVTSEDDPISTMMPAIWIGIPACTAASFGICSMSRYTTPYRRKCLFTAQYVFFIFCCMLIIGLGIYMATEFRSYMDKAEYINPINPVVNMQGNATVTAFPMSISLQQTINRSLIVIRAVELSFMMLLLILCIVSACLVGRELCPECGCDCDCDCDDDDMRPVAPVQPPAAQRAAPTGAT
ncbi:uncharacterized protein LOC129592008 isoform X2 [Paramacrobiotus metropolitanus]|uniref:uncharacterized protein LOC129592008 isoform X2 n=1 Tax=Paramacrobiotus metropolitanus TaxID=2943436 RepID=UPI002445E45A|nr:uncharacterized protein LOC129592008 isoform X2 [Paramacrobiotus metropolitanus]